MVLNPKNSADHKSGARGRIWTLMKKGKAKSYHDATPAELTRDGRPILRADKEEFITTDDSEKGSWGITLIEVK